MIHIYLKKYNVVPVVIKDLFIDSKDNKFKYISVINYEYPLREHYFMVMNYRYY